MEIHIGKIVKAEMDRIGMKHNRHSSLQHTQSYTNDVSLIDMDNLAKKFPAFGS